MKTAILIFALLICGLVVAVSGPSFQNSQKSDQHTSWIKTSLLKMQTVKPGMTRRQLLEVFTGEGGLSSRVQQTYVYRECPYIKVDVKFEPDAQEAAPDKSTAGKLDDDKITEMSKPYLDWSIID